LVVAVVVQEEAEVAVDLYQEEANLHKVNRVNLMSDV
jgi:hypothetical protein